MTVDVDNGPGASSTGRVGDLVESWAADRVPFDAWVRRVSRAFFASRLRLEGAAKLLGTTPAELQAVLSLATLEDDDLALFTGPPPPRTTWLTFAHSTTDGIEAGLEALRTLPAGESPFHAVEDAVRAVEGPGVLQRVAELSGTTFVHMGEKAKQYNQLGTKGPGALQSMGRQKRTGKPLTPRQVAYAYNLLEELADRGAVRRDSPDDDQADCDAVLDALGL
jgi:hypothetical protein